MVGSPAYVLDADVFIRAKNDYYRFNLCPGFWEALISQHQSKRIFSIERIYDQIMVGDDRLSEWISTEVPSTCFVSANEPDVVDSYTQMVNWVQSHNRFNDSAKQTFLSDPDAWLLAYAHAKSCTLVTLERYNPDIERKVPIPNVCRQFEVECCNTFVMLTDLGVSFVEG